VTRNSQNPAWIVPPGAHADPLRTVTAPSGTPPFRHPIVYIDERAESERAIELAAALAPRAGALEVLEPLPIAAGDTVDPALLDLSHLLHDARVAHLEELSADWATRGFALTTRATWGTPSVEVIRQVLADRHDLVIKVARGRPQLGWPMFGSVAQHLVRKCPAPVWLLAPDRPLVPRRVLAVVTPDPASREPGALELQVLGLARAVAAHCHAALDVVRPWFVGVSRLLPLRRTSLDALERLRAGAKESFAKLLATADMDPRHALFLEGPTAEAVARQASATGVDLVVIGTVPRGAGAGLLIREDAEDLLARVSCSILAVKPEDFATPVHPADG
jgi:universal stress protein E